VDWRAEPLEYPEIPRFANALASSGHEVFLHTNGSLLRRRMHEFQPTQRFRFVLRFGRTFGCGQPCCARWGSRSKLSGFWFAAERRARRDEIDALARLHAELHRLDLDGYLIVPAAGTASSGGVLNQARERLLNRRWRRLSEMFDGVIANQALQRRWCGARQDPAARRPFPGALPSIPRAIARKARKLMTTLVTGAAGFLGSHVVRQLVARGQQVRVLLRPSARTARLLICRWSM
jgi:hypothetical protein